MQTIKTAAVVVLMLTVLYGGYVSLTTPPDPPPEEIQQLIVTEEFNGPLDFNENPIATDLQLSEPPTSMLSAQEGMSQPEMSLQSPGSVQLNDPRQASMQDANRSGGTFGSAFADLPASQQAARSAPVPLPRSSSPPPNITPRDISSYQSTSGEFSLPDPNAAAASFSSSEPFRGSPQSPGTGFQMSDQASLQAPAQTASGTTPLLPPGSAISSLQPPAAGADLSAENRGLANALLVADQLHAKGQLREALATLSVFSSMPGINEKQTRELYSRLDPLARDVIYSKRHLLEQPYRINASETLAQVASRFEVPWQLLANINRVNDPVTILPGTELKVVRGPFRADVDLTGKELTLYLGDLYAGRFQVEVGNDPPPAPGTFTVQEKQTSHVYYDRSGVPVPAGSEDNPYGNMWLDLGGQLCIHGSPNTVKPTDKGCISLAADYADDLYGILSQGSSVSIRR